MQNLLRGRGIPPPKPSLFGSAPALGSFAPRDSFLAIGYVVGSYVMWHMVMLELCMTLNDFSREFRLLFSIWIHNSGFYYSVRIQLLWVSFQLRLVPIHDNHVPWQNWGVFLYYTSILCQEHPTLKRQITHFYDENISLVALQSNVTVPLN